MMLPSSLAAVWTRAVFEEYCPGGICQGSLFIPGNLTVTGSFANVTVNNYNVTGAASFDGDLSATNIYADLFIGNGSLLYDIRYRNLTDQDISNFGYLKQYRNLTDNDISNFGYIKEYRNLTDEDISNFGYIKQYRNLTYEEVREETRDYYVNITGDTMSGNLIMENNNVLGADIVGTREIEFGQFMRLSNKSTNGIWDVLNIRSRPEPKNQLLFAVCGNGTT
ncbi:MAG: hypothetical protein R3250_12880, partial [Melioribacteraceae bacterium]|nr:hypothetical protein [Melioribacteraceae bacterium]